MPVRDMSGSEPALQIRGVAKAFGGVRALRGVDLEVRGGEILGLVGDNGAGKSTLVRCISGVHRPDAGEIVIHGAPQVELTPDRAREMGVETVHQDLSLVDNLDVTRNFFLNRELVRGGALGPLAWLRKRAMYAETTDLLQELGLAVDAHAGVSRLSGGQRQMIVVARAVHWGSTIVLLDEPAAALGVRQTAQVLRFIRTMAERGVAVVFISHNMQHILRATDRVVVLRHGEKVGDLQTAKTSGRELVTLITGSDLDGDMQDGTLIPAADDGPSDDALTG
jgi:ABC-type sugar transport system ATPase subunit